MTIEIIIPLAGPDFVDQYGQIKGQDENGKLDSLYKTLKSRSWFHQDNRYTFVFLDNKITRALYEQQVTDWFNNTSAIFLTHETKGAAFSALVAIAKILNRSNCVIIDLADIRFECQINPIGLLSDPTVGAVGLTFLSESPIYSYLKFDENDQFVMSIEKQVISQNASAGVYIFKSSFDYMAALVSVVRDIKKYEHNGLLYVCPVLNGIAQNKLRVLQQTVTNIYDPKIKNE